MKKIYLLLLLFVISGTALRAQCTIDTNNTTLGITPPDSLLPPIIIGTPYDTTVQVYVPGTFTYTYMGIPVTITIRWVYIDTIESAPTGITYSRNPTLPANDTLYPNGNACFKIYGTTNDTAGTYPLSFQGWVRFHASIYFTSDTTLPLSDLSALGASPFSFSLKVVNPAGIYDINHQLEQALQVMPNPNNGQFDIKIKSNSQLTGDIRVMDATGRVVYSDPISATGFYAQTVNLSTLAKGIYAVQLRTTEGTATKLVSVE